MIGKVIKSVTYYLNGPLSKYDKRIWSAFKRMQYSEKQDEEKERRQVSTKFVDK